MDVLVIGLGSMGKRRIRLLKQFRQVENIFGVDAREDRRKEAEKKFLCKTYRNMDDALNENRQIKCVFVSTAPLSHADLINTCLKKDLHVFSELNLVDTRYDENVNLAKDKNKTLFLSSTFLYRREVSYMRDQIQTRKERVNYLYHAGQYLPDWHPWESYKDFFVGQKKTNGCREFMAIDFPWLTEVFGKIKAIEVKGSRISSLEINYPDNYVLLLEHENGNKGAVVIDIVSRKSSRNLEVFGKSVYFTWDGTPDGLYWYDYKQKKDLKIQLYESVDQQSGYSAFIIENAYYNEISNFFQVLEGAEEPKYSFERDKEILKMIDDIERKAEEEKGYEQE